MQRHLGTAIGIEFDSALDFDCGVGFDAGADIDTDTDIDLHFDFDRDFWPFDITLECFWPTQVFWYRSAYRLLLPRGARNTL